MSRASFETFLNYLQHKGEAGPVFAAATENLYLTAMVGFVQDFLYAVLERTVQDDIRVLVKRRRRKVPLTQRPCPKESIEAILAAVAVAIAGPFTGRTEMEQRQRRLGAWRDYALLLLLAQSGLRVFETCGLRRNQVDYREGNMSVMGKGEKEAQVRLSPLTLRVLKTYLRLRANADRWRGARPPAA